MVPLTHVRIEYTIDGEERESASIPLIVNRDQIEWLAGDRARPRRVPEPRRRAATIAPKRPCPTAATDGRRPPVTRRRGPLPSGDHGRHPSHRPARGSPRHRRVDGPRRAVLHDAARRSRGGGHQDRTPGRRFDTWLGAAVGRCPRMPTGAGRPPTTWRSTATSAGFGSTSRPPTAPRSSGACSADADVLVENLRVGAFARLGFDEATLDGAEPARSSTSRSPATGRAARRPTGPATTSSSRRRAG